jgi:DNA-binding CsgD family transcriptional regulator
MQSHASHKIWQQLRLLAGSLGYPPFPGVSVIPSVHSEPGQTRGIRLPRRNHASATTSSATWALVAEGGCTVAGPFPQLNSPAELGAGDQAVPRARRGRCVSRDDPARPYRAVLSEDTAARELRNDARDGRLDQLAVDAVLVAAGQAKSLPRPHTTVTLTVRETDVLRSLAQANESIAKRLKITPKTAGNHAEHIYTKLGVANRAAATVRAIQDRLI